MTTPAFSADPPPMPGDAKDWTWVLERPCAECGYVAEDVELAAIAPGIRANVAQWLDILKADPGRLGTRARPDHWSAIEYAAHVRDVFDLYSYRLGLMLEQDGPHYPNWDQDVTAVEKRYHESDPAVLATELAAAGERLAAEFDAVEGDGWERTGFRSDGAAFTVASFARYLLHDPVHHVHDVHTGFAELDAAAG